MQEWKFRIVTLCNLTRSRGESLQCAAQLDIAALYQSEGEAPVQRLAAALEGGPADGTAGASLQALSGIVWTPSMRRMYTLVDRST